MRIQTLAAILILLSTGPAAVAMETTLLAPLDRQRLLADDAVEDGPIPLRISTGYTVAVSAKESDLTFADGRYTWRHAFEVPGATDLSLAFDNFKLPAGAALYIYDPDKTYLRGPYTAADNEEHGELWSPMVPGDRVIAELVLPRLAASASAAPGPISVPPLRVMQVNAGYRDMFGREGKPNLSRQGACHIDVVCPQADPWRDELRSVARYTINIDGQGFLCTGQLVVDEPVSLTPYFLTAGHCGPSAATDQTMVFYWNFESPACGQLNGGSLADAQSGAIFRAGRANVDSSLVELEELPDPDFEVYYGGWDASGASPSTGSVGIHHPAGDEKAISFNVGPAASISVCIQGTNSPSGFWLLDWEEGVTEPGSSGSALWSTGDKKIIGTLSGGSSACVGTNPNNGTDCYGKLAAAWAGGSSDAQRLKPWLDPDNTGTLVKNGVDPTAGECGDSVIHVGEVCDDGNTVNGDGCSSSCQIENGWECDLPAKRGITDGGFEGGSPNNNWFEFSTNFTTPICSDTGCAIGIPDQGDWFAFFGREADGEVGILEQRLIIPDDATTLSFNILPFTCDSPSDFVRATIDGTEVIYFDGGDPGCPGFVYTPLAGDITAFADDQSHLLRIESEAYAAQGGRSRFWIDEVAMDGDSSGPGIGSACRLLPEVCVADDFESGLINWTTFSTGPNTAIWGSTNDGVCNSNQTEQGNFTGGSGEAACVDSDVAGAGAVDTYLCGPAVNLTTALSPAIRFLHNYQIDGPPDAGDSFSLLIGNQPPSAGTIGSYDLVFEQLIDSGASFATPGFEANLDLSAYGGQQVHACFRYRADSDWYAQIDDYRVTAEDCVSNLDSDGDGVNDAVDLCPNTPPGETVNGDGCSDSQLDTDGDGVSDAADMCPNTPPGETVNGDGCSDSQLDTDGDGVSDAADMCPNTPPGETVNGDGCSDSQLDTDGDGISDAADLCPNTPPGETVNGDGCSDSQLDADGDGVSDAADLCPNTPPGETVNGDGCSDSQLDTDGDGVSDAADLCPNTPPGETVNGDGCSDSQLDTDGDGVSDAADLCPNTPPGETVNGDGCSASQIDTDGDGVFDSLDNCTLIINPTQRDTNGDNIGNDCDADIDNNCVVNFLDLNAYRANFFMAGDLDTDNNGDNTTNFLDLQVPRAQFFDAPGPSGLPNACD